MTKAVRIIHINAGTHAETLERQKGYLVLEYDGMRILHSKQLVDAVKRKKEGEMVEMGVGRDRQPGRLMVSGGLIGINVRAVAVPTSELGM